MHFVLKKYTADLHLHTCLSPCADLCNTPKRFIEKAKALGIQIIGICDHNSAENVSAALRYAEKYCSGEILVVPGIEITTREEIHILGLFAELLQVLEMQAFVYARLSGVNKPEVFGDQIVVNEDEEVLGFNERFLAGAVDASMEEVIVRIHKLEGLAIAAHIDRPSFSVISQLGFVPAGAGFDALEVSPLISLQEAKSKFPELREYTFVTFSDAHQLDWIGTRVTNFLINEPSLAEIKLALAQQDERRVLLTD